MRMVFKVSSSNEKATGGAWYPAGGFTIRLRVIPLSGAGNGLAADNANGDKAQHEVLLYTTYLAVNALIKK